MKTLLLLFIPRLAFAVWLTRAGMQSSFKPFRCLSTQILKPCTHSLTGTSFSLCHPSKKNACRLRDSCITLPYHPLTGICQLPWQTPVDHILQTVSLHSSFNTNSSKAQRNFFHWLFSQKTKPSRINTPPPHFWMRWHTNLERERKSWKQKFHSLLGRGPGEDYAKSWWRQERNTERAGRTHGHKGSYCGSFQQWGLNSAGRGPYSSLWTGVSWKFPKG